jgi:phosphoglycolate phosphatase
MIILFDLDGTLIDSTDAILDGFFTAFDAFNYPKPNEDDIKKLIGFPLDIMFAELGVEKDKVDNFVQTYKAKYRVISKQKTILLPNAKDAIELASSFATLGVVTTKTGLYSKELLEHFDVLKYFEVLIGRENVENPKPHQEPILKALEEISKKINIDKNNTYMIGDTILDLISAKNANIKSIAVNCGYGKEEELKKHTNIIKNSSLEVVQYLSKI